MIEPISTTAKKRLRASGIILFKPLVKRVISLAEMSDWDTCPYHIYYSVKSDELISLFLCEITVTRKIVIMNNLRLPEKSDLLSDEPMLIAMAEYVLDRFALNWARRLQREWAISDSCMPHFDVVLDNAGFSPMKIGAFESDFKNKWYRGRIKLKNLEEA